MFTGVKELCYAYCYCLLSGPRISVLYLNMNFADVSLDTPSTFCSRPESNSSEQNFSAYHSGFFLFLQVYIKSSPAILPVLFKLGTPY